MRKYRITYNGSFLNKFPPAILHRNKVNIYIVYEITSNYSDINYPTLENCLFGSVKLTKNADIDKYGLYILYLMVIFMILVLIIMPLQFPIY